MGRVPTTLYSLLESTMFGLYVSIEGLRRYMRYIYGSHYTLFRYKSNSGAIKVGARHSAGRGMVGPLSATRGGGRSKSSLALRGAPICSVQGASRRTHKGRNFVWSAASAWH